MIKSASVKGLLGQYDHAFTFAPEWEFVIVFGLNGVGKTKFLELIDSALRLDAGALGRTQFSRFTVQTDDGYRFRVDRKLFDLSARLTITLTHSGEPVGSWVGTVELPDDDDFSKYLTRSTSWRPYQGNLWQDRTDQEIVHIDELRERFAGHGDYAPSAMPSAFVAPMPESLVAFSRDNRTVLIETQRLGRLTPLPAVRRFGAPRRMYTVDNYAGDLKQRLERALASNSLTSQSLDRTFPSRIIQQSLEGAMTESEIRALHEHQNARRDRLADIGLIDHESDLPLPDQELAGWQRAVLTTYLRDANEKISTFDDLLGRIDLLENLVNERFLNKRVDITAERGLVMFSALSGTEIPITGLSSGEQHELVLLYNLLFNVQPGSLVLVDEPEISLHVSWQKKFLQDVIEIGRSSRIRFLIATHSPQIIGKWWSRTVELGPQDMDLDLDDRDPV